MRLRGVCSCFFRLLFFSTVFGLLAAIAVLGWVWWQVVNVPCPEIEPERIASILGRESPVYYRDGQEKIGVLFEDIHRQYLSYEQLPPQFIKALVAAEDDQFFHHYGIDLPGIAKALLLNYQAGKIVRGGSTLTQQTAKNLFKREKRNYQAKLKEMLYALRLEHRYSKEKILEFYSNQFYVSGNGHGLGVAARYYFDKEPQELALNEAAFIAGSVKGPELYNPFIKKDKAAATEARRRAAERTAYVLDRMLKFNMISQAEHDAAQKIGLAFKRGRTSYDLTTVMDMVGKGLASKAMAEMMAQHGIDNIATYGAKIVTTIDQRLQDETLYSLRRELSRLDVQLRGYERNEVQQEYKEAEGDNSEEDSVIREKSFVFGTIREIRRDNPEQPLIAVSFGPKQPEGSIDRQGLEQLLTALTKYRRQQWAKPDKKDLADLLARLQVGDRVYVSVTERDSFDATVPMQLELERFPKLQGAAVVLQQGAIRALAGGVENRFFNRAADAKRLLGSTMKPFLYAAALQLGWSPLDRLDNRRQAFIFQHQAYFPRPDHKSPFAQVSMSWAGVKSENVASVWLLYHLTDKLTPTGLLETAAFVDMAPRNGESQQQFAARMQSAFGLRFSAADLDCAAFEQAVRKAEQDFQFEGRSEELHHWREIGCPQNLERFREQVRASLNKPDLKPAQRKEYSTQLGLLAGGPLRWPDLRRRRQLLDKYREQLNQIALPAVEVPSFFPNAQQEGAGQEAPDDGPRPFGRLAENGQGRLVFTLRGELPENWQPVDEYGLRRRLASLHPEEQNTLWSGVLLEGAFSAGAADIIERLTAAERAALDQSSLYAVETLIKLRDYRIMLGLQYLIRLARETGIKSRMEPVLSLPLGSNVISLLDSVRMYETLATGSRHEVQRPKQLPEDGSGAASEDDRAGEDGLALIERIEAPDGKVIYSRKPAVTPVLDAKSSSEIKNILQNVVRYGTGHAAWEKVRLPGEGGQHNAALPVLGKTGTANDFRNVAFIGFVPTGVDMDETALLASVGSTVGVYVGFDSNEQMEHGSFRVSGALGALPVWIRLANALYTQEGCADHLAPEVLTGSSIGLRYPETGQLFMPVDEQGGGLMRRGKDGLKTDIAPEEAAVLCHGAPGQYGGFEPERRFLPFWLLRRQWQQPPPQPDTAAADQQQASSQ
ncbi:transglycosylase domain-containing protein [Candidatus Electronema sp. JM]|uniref:transglycosylase domain-containing protein n=1 Tax=Candidatus Electronema sp. JM TaxID=3401571 RepID=UPI003AA84502